MKKIAPLILFVVFAVFAQQQNAIPRHSAVQAPPMPIPQDTLPEPVVPLVPAQPLPEELVPIAAPQMQLDSTHAVPVAQQPTDSASIAPPPAATASIAPTPAPAPKDTTPPKPSMPKNTITIDLGPTIIGVGVETAAKTFGKSKLKDVTINAFGIGAQYEFQPIRFLSLPLKFSYMDFKTKVTAKKEFKKDIDTTLNLGDVPDPDDPDFPSCLLTSNCPLIPKDTTIHIDVSLPLKAKLEAELSIWSIEAHPRLYPFGGSFFLEGMLGYASLSTDFKGEAIASVKVKIPDELADFDIPGLADTSYKVGVKFKASRGYLKYGGKLGWRADFGKPGGFIFEHALGFYGASGLGNKTIVDQLATNIEETVINNPPPGISIDKEKGVEVDTKKFNDAFGLLEKFIFVGGPRYTFAFGWRF